MQALDTGYKLSATVGANGLQYLQYHNPQVWKLVLETEDLQSYSPQYAVFAGRYIIETNNNTLIPYGLLGGYGLNLSFWQSTTFYNGS